MGSYIIKGAVIYDNDVVNLVLQSIDYGSVWKNIRSVSKNIYLLSIKYQESKLIELANPILSLIYIYPNNRWDIYNLSKFNIISIDFIRLTYDKPHWDKEMISMSTGITINDILNADPDSIDWEEISMNPSIKVSDMLKHDLPWNYMIASENTSIRIEDIRNNLDKDWYYSRIARNSSLSIEDLSTIMDLSNSTRWWKNKNATYENVLKYNNRGFIYLNSLKLVRRFSLDEDILQEYIDIFPSIKGHEIHNQSITPNVIGNNPQLNWDRLEIDYSKFTVEEMMNIPITDEINIERILYHPDFTIEDFFKYFDVNTFKDLFVLSESPWLTFDIVLKYKDIISWEHWGLNRNPNVTVDILEDSNFSWIEWDYYELSRYAQINWVYIIRNSDKEWYINEFYENKSLNYKI